MYGILKRLRLAQRLLCTLVPMLAAGCLWPTSLTDAVNDNQNVRPVLISADPPVRCRQSQRQSLADRHPDGDRRGSQPGPA